MLAAVKLSAGNIERQTEKAIALNVGNTVVWMPKSQITIYADTRMAEYERTYAVVMPVWLAKQKGFWGYDCFGKPICALFEDEFEAATRFQDYTVYC